MPAPIPGATMTMSCVDGAAYQCSGSTVLRVDNGVGITASGVQAYGKSASDLLPANPTITTAFGLLPASGGTADVRVARSAATSAVTQVAVVLDKLGISWDGKVERPRVVETFDPTQGITRLDASGALAAPSPSAPLTLPPATDLSFYNFANLGPAATQADYANNRYFPRTAPIRCPPPPASCSATETAGITFGAGDFSSEGLDPDRASAQRLHSDGDVHAGDAGPPNPDGSPNLLPGATGEGVPFAGTKGYRNVVNFSYYRANLAAWVSEDTTLINEWAATNQEHTLNRRGTVAYGIVTDPAAVPRTGTVTYTGFAYGWYSKSASEPVTFFRAQATASVDFQARQVTVQITKATTDEPAAVATVVPFSFTTVAGIGAPDTNVANYLSAAVDTGDAAALKGGLGARFFGPINTAPSGTGPDEMAGSFTMSNATTGVTAIGGFIVMTGAHTFRGD
ncbi:MAG TPA: hypothetical protein VN680_03285 [Burkholderiaceae bacterium]|nr:hypothetical protein [Burkholderiaceae bacterium]